jgi:methyl coenzyme M reductase beta subunit
MPPAGAGAGIKNKIQNIGQNPSRQEGQHYIKRDLRRQHIIAATHENSMVATQHGSNTTW